MERVANPKVLGFVALASAGWVYSLPPAGWAAPDVLALPAADQAAVFAMLALLIAGIFAFVRGEGWYGAFFIFWSALWWSLHATHAAMATAPNGYDGWFDAALALGSAILWIGALRTRLPIPVVLVSLGVTIVLLGFALATWLSPVFRLIAGYVGLASAVLAFWAAWAEAAPVGAGPAPAPASSAAASAGRVA